MRLATVLTLLTALAGVTEAHAQAEPPRPRAVAPSAAQPMAPTRLAEGYLRQNRPAQAAQVLRAHLRSLDEAELPQALLLLGQARLAMAGQGGEDEQRPLLIAAGLDLMRIYAHWPQSPQAPEALWLAAQVSDRLGNALAGELARRRVLAAYPTSPAGRRARAALPAADAAGGVPAPSPRRAGIDGTSEE